MKIKVLFFGSLSDITGKLSLVVENIENVENLKEKIECEYTEIKNKKYSISVNKQLITNNINLKDNDEVAFLPPFAGG